MYCMSKNQVVKNQELQYVPGFIRIVVKIYRGPQIHKPMFPWFQYLAQSRLPVNIENILNTMIGAKGGLHS